MIPRIILFACLHLLTYFTGAQCSKGMNGNNTMIYATSVATLTMLKEIEDSYIGNLTEYTKLLKQKVTILEKYLEKLNPEIRTSHEERIKYTSNSIKAFGLVRRLHNDWPKWHNYTKAEVAKDQVKVMEELLLAAPQSEDMREAFKGIFRIEHNYDLEAADIADGMLWGKQYDAKLSTSDCLAIAEYMYNKSEYISAAKWYRVALSHHIQFDDDIFRNIYGSQREDIRKNYIISRLKAGKADDVQLYLKELSHDPKTQLENTAKPTPSISQLGCRGLYPPRTNLSCRYNFTNTPYSRLAPLKMEIVNENPFIVLYHDILYEHEINSLTNQSITTDGWTDDAEPELEVERICKVSTVQDRKIGRRVEQMSGLNVDLDNYMQLSNYGLGGHFRNHFDYVDLKGHSIIVPLMAKYHGDRFATVLFYLSNVELGGATIFPRLNLTIWPQRGAALLWYNLDNSVEPEKLSEHAVCPVIVGSRWVLAEFIVQYKQTFKRPCYK